MRYLLLLSLLLTACGKTDQEAVTDLQRERKELETQVENLRWQVKSQTDAIAASSGRLAALAEDEQVAKAIHEGSSVRYALTIEIRQIHYSLSIKKQAADMMNAETFDIMVDRITYENASVGANLFDSFRTGSAIFKGSLGSWRLKVTGKRLIIIPGVER